MNNKVITEFANMFGLLDYIQDTPPNNHSRSATMASSFCNKTWEQGLEEAKYGNYTSTEEFKEKVELIKGGAEVYVEDYRRDVTGEFFDVGAFVNGEPECWFAEAEHKPTQTIDVIVNTTLHCGINIDVLQKRGAAITAVIDMLCKDYIVNVRFVKCVDYYDDKQYQHWLDVSNNPLDIDTVNFATSNPAYLRRFMFAVLEKKTGKSDCDGYGQPADISQEQIGDAVYFCSSSHYDFNRSDFETVQTAQKYVAKVLKRTAEKHNSS